MSEIIVTSKDAPLANAGSPPANHTAWLEQLESAQWQAKARYQSGGRENYQHDGNPHAAAKNGFAKTSSNVGTLNPQRHSGGNHPVGSDPIHTQEGQLRGTQLITQNSTQNVLANALPHSLEPRFAGSADHEAVAPQNYRQFSRAAWQAQHSHVMLSSEGLRLWLRDARYDVTDGEKLLRELRQHFADLGLRLAQFTLNGEQILGTGYFESSKSSKE